MKKVFLVIFLIIILIFLFSIVFYFKDSSSVSKISNFKECEDNGFPIMESYPRQCRTPDGRIFIEEIENGSNKEDLIIVDIPQPNSTVSNPLTITGQARGFWFFEASFPVKITDVNGEILGSGIAEAQGEWMTEDFVPFMAVISFTPGALTRGILVLEKDNPSGLPENDDKLEIPINFAAGPVTIKECKPTGCSGQVCSDEDIITTCEFLPQYACYKEAVCERQATGKCGWTETPKFKSCIANI